MRVPILAVFAAASAIAQPPSPAPPKPAPPARPSMSAFPTRPPADPEVVARGKAVYGVHCTFCHGADARGGSGGPNLIRTEVVLNDQDGELLGPVLREGRQGMPKFDLPGGQVKDIAAFLHSFRVGGYDQSRMTPETIVVGNAAAGKAYFDKTCARCHAAGNRDLKGIASQITDPKNLQQTWLMPGPRRGFGPQAAPPRRVSPTTVTVTLANGQKAEGVLNRVDDFIVTLTDKEGRQRSFTRNGDSPKVEIHDPLAPHKALLPVYTDKDIHDVTAYLVTLK